jgi:RimJ/RimL family protein N-acetyltransferase
VRRHLWDDRVIEPEETRAILDRSEHLFAARGFGLWCLVERFAKRPMGFGGFWHFRDPPELELILGLDPALWDRGFATEAGRALIRYGFQTLDFTEIRGSTDVANRRSVRLMERLGMKFDRRAVVGGLDTVFYQVRRGK